MTSKHRITASNRSLPAETSQPSADVGYRYLYLTRQIFSDALSGIFQTSSYKLHYFCVSCWSKEFVRCFIKRHLSAKCVSLYWLITTLNHPAYSHIIIIITVARDGDSDSEDCYVLVVLFNYF